MGFVGFFAVLGLTGRPIPLPVWAVVEAEARINKVLSAGKGAPAVSVALGSAVLRVDRDWVPRLQIDDLRLMAPSGRTIANLPEVRVAVDPEALIAGDLRPSSLRVIGAQVTLRRLADGSLDIAFDAEPSDPTSPPPGSLGELLDLVEAGFDAPFLSKLDRIDAEGLTLTLDDRRARRVWQVGDGRISLENRPDELALGLGFGLLGAAATPAQAELTFISVKGSSEARMTATIDLIAAADLAAQAPALAWLKVLDAPISGTLAAGLDEGGTLTSINGTLAFGKGALQPTPETKPIGFDKAGLAFSFDPAAEELIFSDLVIESPSLKVKASGKTHAPGIAKGVPSAFVSQVRVADLAVDPEGLFQEPARFSEGAVDTRLTLDPFRLDIGQLTLVEGNQRLTARGAASADTEGWNLALDLDLNQIPLNRLLALWPVGIVPKTREWVAGNAQEGLLRNVRGAVRLRPGEEPKFSLGYDFAGADVRFIRTLPPIRDGNGYAVINGLSYTMVLNHGTVTPPKGGPIDVSGSVFQVGDITQKPAMAKITLKSDSTITAALSLLDEKPFGYLTKAGYPVDVAEGRARGLATLSFALKPKITTEDVDYVVTGQLADVTSDKLVPGRVLSAEALVVDVTPKGMSIAGPGFMGKAAFDATWRQAFGPEAKGRSRVEGKVELSDTALQEFGVALPADMVTGASPADIVLDLRREDGGDFRLTSDLVGVGLSLPAIALSKAAKTPARFEVEGRLGKPASVDRLALESGAVLAEGSVALKPDGSLDLARFDRVKSGDWLEASVDLTAGSGPEQPVDIAVTGGRLDLRNMPETGMSTEGGPPLAVTLDTVQVTEGIALTGFRGAFNSRGGFNGDFVAQVNGAAGVTGALGPTKNGTAVRLQSNDAGGVIAASGIFERARGGSLDMTLTPRGGRGEYDGRADVANIQVRDAPVLAELLGAISVVGLLEQLNNSGLAFTSGQTDFTTSPAGVNILRGSAIGASLGVSLSGTYLADTSALDMQGVISPIYILNGIGSIFTRRGEGLFGFAYRLTGTSSEPEVSVNPLSILTPGMFREIFRAPPPTVGDAG